MKTNAKVDRLGILQAQIAALQTEASKIKKSLLAQYGDGNVFGQMFEVNLQHNVESLIIDRDLLTRRVGEKVVKSCSKVRRANKVTVTARQVD